MNDLTVLIVSREDSDVIGDAIKSVADIADEIVVIDSNRDEETEVVARKLGAKVVKHPFKDFSDQRNFATLQAHTKWILFLDSDERATQNFKLEVLQTIKEHSEESPISGYYVKRKTYYYGRDWNMDDKVQRLFLRSKFVEWRGVVHETPVIRGELGMIKAPLIHLTHRNLSQMVRKTNEWSEYEAKLRFQKNHPKMKAWRFLRVMGSEFLRSYIQNKGYKNGTHGMIEALYQSFSIFITYAKLWEMQEQKQK